MTFQAQITSKTIYEGEWSGFCSGEVEPPWATDDEKPLGTKPKKPPTSEELRTIKDANDLYRSSAFKLQIDALLPHVRPKASRIPPLDAFLLALHAFIKSIPFVEPQHPLDAARSLSRKGASVPFSLPLPTKDVHWTVSFEKPSNITVVGSWANKVSVKGKDESKFGVDLAVEMPEGLFQEKDYLNGRFFHKRAFYLAILAAAIKSKESGLNVNTFYDSAMDDPRLTTLVLLSCPGDSQNDFSKLNAQVRIIPVLPQSSRIPLHRLSPSQANIRIPTVSNESSANKNIPSPVYNTALLAALTATSNLLTTHSWKQSVPAFSDALTLLRVWANQRGYGKGSRHCVRGFEGLGSWWGAVLGLLIAGEEPFGSKTGKGKKKKPTGRGLSSYQLFKAAVDFLAKQNFENDPVYLKTKDGHRFPPEEYETHHKVVFVDSSSMINLLAGIPITSLEMLRYDANITLELLDDSSLSKDPFTEVYLKEQRNLPTRFDTIIHVDMSSSKLRNPSLHNTLDHGSPTTALFSSLASLIRRGLGNRTKAIAILHPTSQPRPITQSSPCNPKLFQIGLIHDPKNAFRLVDHGPAADDPDPSVAELFRDFWGDKAELRRFKDGRIVESVVWDVKTLDERAHIPALVVRHILARHFGLMDDAVQTWQMGFDNILRLPDMVSRQYQASGVATGFKGAITAFDNLVKGIKAVDDNLPLALLSISPASEYLRYTSVFSPVPVSASVSMSATARYLPSMEIVLEFEKSSKWPDDLRAIQKIKLAFFERFAMVLMKAMVGVKATVVVGDDIRNSEIQDDGRLEIVTPEGWAFSARIWHEREAILLDRIIDSQSDVRPHVTIARKQEVQGGEYQDALAAKEIYCRKFIHAPRHHRAIASLCHHFPAYAGTVRLVKRWLASHWLLHGHISEEVVEIICCSRFIGMGKGSVTGADGDVSAKVPGSRERGFSLVIEFLKDWEWGKGLFVPLYGNTESNGSSNFPKINGLKSGAWTVSTEVDVEGHIWTSHGPDAIAAHRVRALAQATWDCLQGMEHGHLDVKTIFVHPTEDYDFLIQLDPAVLPRYFQNVMVDPEVLTQTTKYANLSIGEAFSAPIRPGFDAAQLLFDDLKRIYADTFKLFYDPFGGDQFGAVWDPSLKKSRPFRVLGGFSSMPNEKESEKTNDKVRSVLLNKTAVLDEIGRMGRGLVKGITSQI